MHRRPSDCALAAAAAPDRHFYLGRRTHQRVEIEELATMADLLAGPEFTHRDQQLVQPLAACVEIDARQLIFFLDPARGNATGDPAFIEDGAGGNRFRRREGVAQRGEIDIGHQLNFRRDRAHRRQRHPGVGPGRGFRPEDLAVGRIGIFALDLGWHDQVVGAGDTAEPKLLGILGNRNQLVDFHHGHQRQPEFHIIHPLDRLAAFAVRS